eukprot:276722-Amphidinium_carterae.1
MSTFSTCQGGSTNTRQSKGLNFTASAIDKKRSHTSCGRSAPLAGPIAKNLCRFLARGAGTTEEELEEALSTEESQAIERSGKWQKSAVRL